MFQVLRPHTMALSLGSLLESHRDKLKPEVIWNIEKGLGLQTSEIVRAEHRRATMMSRAVRFFETYDLLLCPATIVPPFPIGERFVAACNGVRFETYVDWLAIAYAITLVCSPALSLPCGYTGEGLPVGLQVIAAPNADGRVLAGAKVLEDLLGLNTLVPIAPNHGRPGHRS